MHFSKLLQGNKRPVSIELTWLLHKTSLDKDIF